jgi:hypothetical protein
MGANLVYLPRPNKKKNTLEGRSASYRFVCSSMQGWRLNMVIIYAVKSFNRKMRTFATQILITSLKIREAQ